MWLYSGTEDTTRIHPQEVDDVTLKRWMTAITGNKDNPRGARRILPLDQSYEPDKATTELYSMPNGAQAQTEEEEGSGGESQEEWESDGDEGDEDAGSDEKEEEQEEEEVAPPRSERRSKLAHEPAVERGKATAPIVQSTKRPRTTSPAPTEKAPKQSRVVPSKPTKALPKMKMVIPTISGAATSDSLARPEDQEMEDAVTSNPAPSNIIIDLPNDDEDEEPLRQRRNRRAPAGETAQVVSAPETLVAEGDNITRPTKSCELTARYTELENNHIQLELDLKLVQENFTKAKEEAKDKLRDSLKKKDLDLAEVQKASSEKTRLTEEKLASISKLEEENTNLKAALDVANEEVTRLKNDKMVLSDKASELVGKKNELEAYLEGLAKKLFLMLEEFCQNFEEGTSRVETGLDPINSPVKDEAAMNMLCLESRVAAMVDYLARLKVATSRIDTVLWSGETLQNDLESLMTQLNEVPSRVQEWKKSSARCGADVALSLVRVHCKDAREDKLASLKVANTRSFMETFIAAATRIADGIDLDEFVAPSSPPREE
ncbi:hypothetical protein VPH35_055891 [Triticum aestivum]